MGSCCPAVDILFLPNGIEVRERGQGWPESCVRQFFPFRAIQTVRYAYSRDDREAIISIWISGQGSPGAGGLAFRWSLGCSEEASRTTFERIIAALT